MSASGFFIIYNFLCKIDNILILTTSFYTISKWYGLKSISIYERLFWRLIVHYCIFDI